MRQAELTYLETRTVDLIRDGPLTARELARELGVTVEIAREVAKGLVSGHQIDVEYSAFKVDKHGAPIRKAIYKPVDSR